MVRPFVRASSGGRPRQGAPGGGQGQGRQNSRQQQPNARQQPNGRGRQNGPGPGPGPDGSRPGGQGVPGPRPPRDADPHQVPGLLSTPMPPPRAVARNAPPQNPAPYPEPDVPMSDLTTTMPILAVPADDGYDEHGGHPDHYPDHHPDHYPDHENAAPGEHGHFHDDTDWGRHRGGNRPPRALKIGALLAGVAVVGVAAYSVLGGGSGQPSAGPAAAGSSTANGAAGAAPGTPSDSATSAPGTPSPTGSPTDSGSASTSGSTPSTSHSSKTPSKTPSSSHPSTPSSSQMTSRPSSAPSTPPSTTVPAPPPATSSASPAFTVLGPGSSGPAVSQLQQNLKKSGDWWLKVTGTWNGDTTSAVQNFQDANPGTSPPDAYGTYGAATDKALQSAVGN